MSFKTSLLAKYLVIAASKEALLERLLATKNYKNFVQDIQVNRTASKADFESSLHDFIRRFKPEFEGGQLKLYRVLSLIPGETVDFAAIGNSWTWNKKAIHKGQDWGSEKSGGEWKVLVGLVSLGAIDFKTSLLLNLSLTEDEITLKDGGTVSVLRMYDFKNPKDTEVFNPPRQAVVT